MNKIAKITNPGYSEYVRYDYIIEETEKFYKCSERKLNKDFTISGTSLVWEFATSEEQIIFIQDMRTIPIIEDIHLIEDIRLMSYIISKETLCSGGRDLWYIVNRCIEEKLKSYNITDRFLYNYYGHHFLATRTDKYEIQFNFEQISDELYKLIQDEDLI